jgi:hypothetical protein
MGKQAHRQPNVGQPPNLLHRKMTQEAPVFGSHSQSIMFQGSGTGCTRAGISRKRRKDAQAMMFALLQDQPKSQLEAMATANKAMMDAMMECMNAILGAGGGRTSKQNRENIPPATNNNRGGDKEATKVKRKKKLCPHCSMLMFHKPNRCYELDGNKDKQWVGWILVKEAST